MSVIIRKAEPADMPAVRAVMGAATAQLRSVYRPAAASVARAKADEEIRWLVAVDGDEVVAALRYKRENDRLHFGLGARPDYQRRGVGRGLVEALAAVAASDGLGKLSLYTIKQTGNVPIFARMGFNVVKEEPAQDVESITGEALAEVYMEKQL